MSLRTLTRLEEKILEVSPEARDARRSERLAEIAPPLGRKMLGRKRSSPTDKDRLPLPIGSDVLAADIVVALAHHLEDKHPLLNKFNDHYQVKPDRQHVDAYINGGVRSNEGMPTPDHPDEAREYFTKRHRQALHVGDKLQIEAFQNRNIARMRRYSLMTTQFMFQNGRAPDEPAVIHAADALQDFGHTLSENSHDLLAPLGNEDIGYQISVIGAVASHDPSILSDNPTLLRLVQIEQKAREEHWDKLFTATVSHPDIGDRLTKQHHSDEAELQAELARMALLRQD